jgi:uncharacterized membrane protein (UPF0127 family)
VLRRVTVTDVEQGQLLAVADLADGAWSRTRGLLGRRALPRGDGLVIRPCSMIHTLFMRFAIDVLFVDRTGTVVSTVDTLQPFRLAWGGWRAAQAIELPAGALREAGVQPGRRIRIEPAR